VFLKVEDDTFRINYTEICNSYKYVNPAEEKNMVADHQSLEVE